MPNTEYPEIVKAEKSPNTVNIIRDLMSGKNSEFSAIGTYTFQQLLTEALPEIASAIENISIVEMRHLELLGKAVISFGGTPYFVNSRRDFWSARDVNYEKKIEKFLQDNIKAEQAAIADYIVASTRVNNESLKKLFYRIIEDEQEHIEIFNSILSSLKNSNSDFKS